MYQCETREDHNRQSDTNLTEIKAVYTSDSARSHEWKPDAIIEITVTPLAV